MRRVRATSIRAAKQQEQVLLGVLARGEWFDTPGSSEPQPRGRVRASESEPEGSSVREFAAFADNYVAASEAAGRLRASTARTLRSDLRRWIVPVIGHLPLDRINAGHLDQLSATLLDAGLSPKTRRNILGSLSSVLRAAEQRGVVATGTVPSVPRPKLDPSPARALSAGEVRACLSALTALDVEPAFKAAFVLALNTGLRQGELWALTWDNVDLQKRELRVVASRDRETGKVTKPKNGRSRILPLNDKATTALTSMDPCRTGLVFRLPNGRHIVNHNARHRSAKIYSAAGVEASGWHILRHTFATHLLLNGTEIIKVSRLLGHASIELTQRVYAHVLPSDCVDDVAQLCFGVDAAVDPEDAAPAQIIPLQPTRKKVRKK